MAHLKKKHPDKTPHNYNQHSFTLDGCLDLTIAKEIMTSVLDAADQLLLSEGVSRVLGIVSYHSAMEIWRGGGATKERATGSIDQDEGVTCCPM